MIRGRLQGADLIVARMKERIERVAHLETPLQAAGVVVRDDAVKRFKEQGGDQSWTPNKRGGHTGIDTGRLWQSIAVSPPDPTRVSVGTNVSYARWFQEGTGIFAGRSPWTIHPRSGRALAFSIGGVKYVRRSVTIPGQPARPFLLITDTERARIANIFQGWLMTGNMQP